MKRKGLAIGIIHQLVILLIVCGSDTDLRHMVAAVGVLSTSAVAATLVSPLGHAPLVATEADMPKQTAIILNDSSRSGKVVDAMTDQPLAGATVTLDGKEVVITNRNGIFPIVHQIGKVAARAPGYARTEATVEKLESNPTILLRLQPFRAKALYLTVFGIGSRELRHKALSLIREKELNALVIDMKGDRGIIPYSSEIQLAAAIGAQRVKTVGDIKELVNSLKEEGIYTIARIVVFKDNLLGTARPDLAVKKADGQVWLDREQLVWVDASRKEVWDYNIQIAVEAAQNGFDEIQFDYVRFPDHNGLKFAVPNTEENRVASITGFLTEAQQRLRPYNVFLSADIFGYVPWNYDDTQIGQKIDKLVPIVDYISLMLYPSGFHLGIPGFRNAVAHPYEIVYHTMKKAQERTKLSSVHFRPWLQSFKDYAFDRRQFTGVEINLQIKASEDFGSSGWMLWNPRNVYSPDGIKKK